MGTRGGGDITWWLHPCDPEIDDQRDVTATLYQGSDVEGVSGHFQVEEFEAECVAPGREIEVAPRTLVLDVDVMPVWPSVRAAPDGATVWAHEPDVEQVTITDPVDGSRYVLNERSARVEAACDGATTWGAVWERVFVAVGTRSCLDTLAALPDAVLDLLAGQVPRLDIDDRSLRLPDAAALAEVEDAIEDELAKSKWVLLQDRQSNTWSGPCRDIGDRFERAVTLIGVVPFHGGDRPDVALVSMTSEPCVG